MELKNIQLLSDTEKIQLVNEKLERVNEMLDEAFEEHLKFVAKRAAESGRKIREAFGNE